MLENLLGPPAVLGGERDEIVEPRRGTAEAEEAQLVDQVGISRGFLLWGPAERVVDLEGVGGEPEIMDAGIVRQDDIQRGQHLPGTGP